MIYRARRQGLAVRQLDLVIALARRGQFVRPDLRTDIGVVTKVGGKLGFDQFPDGVTLILWERECLVKTALQVMIDLAVDFFQRDGPTAQRPWRARLTQSLISGTLML